MSSGEEGNLDGCTGHTGTWGGKQRQEGCIQGPGNAKNTSNNDGWKRQEHPPESLPREQGARERGPAHTSIWDPGLLTWEDQLLLNEATTTPRPRACGLLLGQPQDTNIAS